MKTFKILILFLIAGTLSAAAQSRVRVEDHQGYVNFQSLIDVMDMEPHIEVNVKGALLKLARGAAEIEDPAFAEILEPLKGIFVRGFRTSEMDGDLYDQLNDQADALGNTLKADGWERMVRVRERRENVNVYIRSDNDEDIQGMVVMVIDSHETIFVNIVGFVNADDIGRIGRKFNIRPLYDYDF